MRKIFIVVLMIIALSGIAQATTKYEIVNASLSFYQNFNDPVYGDELGELDLSGNGLGLYKNFTIVDGQLVYNLSIFVKSNGSACIPIPEFRGTNKSIVEGDLWFDDTVSAGEVWIGFTNVTTHVKDGVYDSFIGARFQNNGVNPWAWTHGLDNSGGLTNFKEGNITHFILNHTGNRMYLYLWNLNQTDNLTEAKFVDYQRVDTKNVNFKYFCVKTIGTNPGASASGRIDNLHIWFPSNYTEYNATVICPNNPLETDSITMSLSLNDSVELSSKTSLYFDYVTYWPLEAYNPASSTVTISNQTLGVRFLNWSYNYSFGNNFHARSSTVGYSFHVGDISFSNCTSGDNNQTLIFFMLEESRNTSKETNLESFFTLWTNDKSKAISYSVEEPNDFNHTFCMEPRNRSINVEVVLKFNSRNQEDYDADYEQRDYWIFNTTVGAINTTRLLYVVNVSAETITINVKDNDDRPLSGAYIEAYRNFPGFNEWRRVESRKSDAEGTTVMYLFPYNELYRFVVFYGGKYYTVTEKIVSASTVNLRVDTSGDIFQSYDIYGSVIYSMAYTNNTGTFSYSYEDVNQQVTQGCVRVTRRRFATKTQICESCVSNYVGTLECAINKSLSGSYTATGYVTIDGFDYPLVDKAVNIGDSTPGLGNAGIILAILTIIFMTLIFASEGPQAALMGAFLGLVMASVMWLNLPIGVIMTVLLIFGFVYWRIRR